MTIEERRQSTRVPFLGEVVYTVGKFSRARRSIDISSEGLSIDEPSPPEEGDAITVEFTLKGRNIKAQGRVVHSQPLVGFAILIEEIELEDRELITEYVLESKKALDSATGTPGEKPSEPRSA